jgi:UDP-N-acetyl-D-galactosamine dehydrogenase
MKDKKIAVIGLGYVGLPLAVEFGKKYSTLGFDINQKRINELKEGFDKTLESNKSEIEASKGLIFSSNVEDLSNFNVYIVTVPTPINQIIKSIKNARKRIEERRYSNL